jgi:hypothetical protein
MKRRKSLAAIGIIAIFGTSPAAAPQRAERKELRTEGKRSVVGAIVRLDMKAGTITLRPSVNGPVTCVVRSQTAARLNKLRLGSKVRLFYRESDVAKRIVTDACEPYGSTSCGNNGCEPDERMVTYKCVDEDGNVTYAHVCEHDDVCRKAKND